MFTDHYIEYRDTLNALDFARAESMVADGMSLERALHYLRGWAQDYHFEAHCETCDAIEFEARSY